MTEDRELTKEEDFYHLIELYRALKSPRELTFQETMDMFEELTIEQCEAVMTLPTKLKKEETERLLQEVENYTKDPIMANSLRDWVLENSEAFVEK